MYHKISISFNKIATPFLICHDVTHIKGIFLHKIEYDKVKTFNPSTPTNFGIEHTLMNFSASTPCHVFSFTITLRI